VLTIVDSERFAEGVEKLFPEVDWDEPVSLINDQLSVVSEAKKKRKKAKK
jgi:acetone carboxylase gamma subunit